MSHEIGVNGQQTNNQNHNACCWQRHEKKEIAQQQKEGFQLACNNRVSAPPGKSSKVVDFLS